jgi:putative membrane protein
MSTVQKEPLPRLALSVILGVSALAIAFLFWLIYFKGRPEQTVSWVGWLPWVNAFLNGSSATALTIGYFFIRQRRVAAHRAAMLSAFAFSSLFLVSYIVYHHFHGDSPFPGHGLIRPIYFFILITHVSLSMVVLPLALTTAYFALTGRFMRHRSIAKITFPLWLYVSVTGVLIVLLLKSNGA